MLSVNNVRTVSDTKRSFYTLHTRPINTIYRRVVEELMVEMHLLSVNVDFNYDPIYALGVVTSFDRFMQGYRPEADKNPIFDALCRSVETDPQRYQNDAQWLTGWAKSRSVKDLIGSLSQESEFANTGDLQPTFKGIAHNPKFKYNRLFAIGLFTLLETADSEFVKDTKQVMDALQQISGGLNLPAEKIQKDLELYRSNLEKMAQALLVMEDTLQAERKKREKRATDKGVVVAPPNGQKGTSDAANSSN